MNFLSVDIETTGYFQESLSGVELPPQTVFHPARHIAEDGADPSLMVLTAAITRVENCEALDDLHKAVPGESHFFRMEIPEERALFFRWITWADVILGHNLKYDIGWLRASGEDGAAAFDGSHLLIDTTVLNYSHCEIRDARSLKDLGKALDLFDYEDKGVVKGYRNADDPKVATYNAEDTHNVVLAASAFCRMIREDYPETEKLSLAYFHFYSDMLWACLRMEEAGFPFSLPKLSALRWAYEAQVRRIEESMEQRGLILRGPGSQGSRWDFMDVLVGACDPAKVEAKLGVPHITGHKLFLLAGEDKAKGIKSKSGRVSFKLQNLILISHCLPDDSPYAEVVQAWIKHTRLSKMISSFLNSLLTKPGDRCVGGPKVALNYPTIYPVASKFDNGEDGGQIQGRLSFRHFALQTCPKPIKGCGVSRFAGGTLRTYDLSAIELRTAAIQSRETTLLDVFNGAGKPDPHADLAVRIWGEEIRNHPYFNTGDNTRDPRAGSKLAQFSLLNWSSVDAIIAQNLKKTADLLDRALVQRVAAEFKHVRPALYRWQCQMVEEANAKGYLTMEDTGQTRILLPGSKPNEAVNFKVQLSAANVMADIVIQVHQALPSLNCEDPPILLCLVTHDSLTLDVKKGWEDYADQMVDDAVTHSETRGMFNRLCVRHGVRIPLTYGLEVR